MSPSICFSCGAPSPRVFYEVSAIPVHSCLLMSTPEDARAYPRRDLELALCEECGFIWNVRFDPRVHEYSTRYEESQAFSAHFNAFAEDLAGRLVERYHLQGKAVLEIGCGKGEFLLSLCEQGAGSGVGIDPGYMPDRQESGALSRVRFIQDFYSEKHADLTGDLVCCRHTLEHIQPVRRFMEIVARSLRGGSDTVIFLEVPDTLRVLEESAFWDIYYEHCSYFTLGSLGRLFRTCGFEILDQRLEYGDQYIVLEARASGGAKAAGAAPIDDLAAVRAGVERFQREIARTLDAWRLRLSGWKEADRRAVLWGSGSKGVAFLTTLGVTDEVAGVVDVNPYRQGRFMPGTGHRILAPSQLVEESPEIVVVMNPVYVPEIRAELARLGLHPQIEALGVGAGSSLRTLPNPERA